MLFHIVGNHIAGYVDDTTIYAVIPRPLLRPQMMESLNQDMAAINSWYLKWHMRPNPNKIKFMVVGRSQTIAPSYGNRSLGGAELEKSQSLYILEVTLESKLTFETHLREVVSKAARRPRLLKSCFNAFVLSSLEHCVPIRMLSAESHLALLDSIICSAERLCEVSFVV